jgi:hypothetical protein
VGRFAPLRHKRAPAILFGGLSSSEDCRLSDTTVIQRLTVLAGAKAQRRSADQMDGILGVAARSPQADGGHNGGQPEESERPSDSFRGPLHVRIVGWRARIRTWNPLIQSQVLYR